MSGRTPGAINGQCRQSIRLEHGSDICPAEDLQICDRGMTFVSPLQLTLGTEMSISLALKARGGKPAGFQVDAMVVDCEEQAPAQYQITLLFLDLPEEIASALRFASLSDNPVQFAENWRNCRSRKRLV
jgi:hypothetical protein